MKSFQFGTVGKRPSASSKKDLEEQKKKLDEQAAAEAFEEYVAVFQDTGASKSASKVWVKAGTYDAGKRQEDTKDRGKLYKPTSRFEGGKQDSAVSSSGDYYDDSRRPDKPGAKKKQSEKKKSNLEIFKEELKIIQEEREERHRLKRLLGLSESVKLPPKPGDDLRASLSLELADDVRMGAGGGAGGGSAGGGGGAGGGGTGGGSIDDGDPNTTNIYLGNLPTKISEQQLMEVFGKYGPLASVKVMWPRTEEEKARNRLSGFVAFMSRRDGERALKHLTGKEILGSEIKLGWGKAVPIPAYPVYIPPVMLELTMPPPLSGLPFNAQVIGGKEKFKLPPPGTPYPTDAKGKEEFEKVLMSATVKVVMPTDRALLSLIHRMVEFVLREGPMLEAMIMNKEINNPQFRFLFENQSPAHVYYRWKLFSLLQGDSTSRWRVEEFRMFKNGSIWRPPKLNPFTSGMPNDLIPEEEREIRMGSLSNAQRTRLERMLRRITPDRHKVAEVMIFSIEHSESIDEICACIRESLCNPSTSLQKKIARLYVVNDVLHNCTARGMNAFGYRKAFRGHLPGIFQELYYSYKSSCRGRGKRKDSEGEEEEDRDEEEGGGEEKSDSNTIGESFKQRVMGCFKAWDEWGVYSSEFLIKLQNIFLGLASYKEEASSSPYNSGLFGSLAADPNKSPPQQANNHEEEEEDDEERARANLTVHRQKLHRRGGPPKAKLPPQSAMKLVRMLQSGGVEGDVGEDLDGVPMEEFGGEDDGEQPQDEMSISEGIKRKAAGSKFIPSKWEELDPEQVKAGAVTTTSKWDLFVEEEGKKSEEVGGEKERDAGGLVMYEDEEDIDGVPMDEEDEEEVDAPSSGVVMGESGEEDEAGRRAKLREVEMKVLAFQDELERRGVVGDGVDLVKEYREKLLKKIFPGSSGLAEPMSSADLSSSSRAYYSRSKRRERSSEDNDEEPEDCEYGRERRRRGSGRREGDDDEVEEDDRDEDGDELEGDSRSRSSRRHSQQHSSSRRKHRSRSPPPSSSLQHSGKSRSTSRSKRNRSRSRSPVRSHGASSSSSGGRRRRNRSRSRSRGRKY